MAVRFGPFVLDGDRRQLFENDGEVHLSPKAYALLTILVGEHPRAVSKADLHARLWPDTFVQDVNLSVLVAEIRSALHDPGRNGRYIRTVHGFGYAFSGELDRSGSTPSAQTASRAAPETGPARKRIRARWAGSF